MIVQVIDVRVERIAPGRIPVFRCRRAVHQALFVSGTVETIRNQNQPGNNGEVALFGCIA
jgi:hypothetical protein